VLPRVAGIVGAAGNTCGTRNSGLGVAMPNPSLNADVPHTWAGPTVWTAG
jgi:hypothetical protein